MTASATTRHLSPLPGGDPAALSTTPQAEAGREYDLPIMPSTQLRLELALFRDPPHLGELTAILREDPVAVLRLFALTEGMPAPHGDILRLEDLVVTLGKEDLLHAFCRPAPACGEEGKAALAFAQQACAVGQMCRTLAETTGLPGEDAYVIGLLHRIGSLPGQLGRTILQEGACLAICRQYNLPFHFQRALGEVEREDASSPWTAMVHAAYELLATSARNRCARDPSLNA